MALISGIFVYRYTQEAAVKELYTMNRTVLKQISKNAGMLFSTVKAASDRLVYDSNLNEILNEEPSGLQGEEYKEKNAQAVQFLSDLSLSLIHISCQKNSSVVSYRLLNSEYCGPARRACIMGCCKEFIINFCKMK